MRARLDQIREAGAQLVLVGNGTPQQAAAFQRRYAPDVAVYTDPSLESYRALGLRRSLAATLSIGSGLAALRAHLRGNRQGRLQGDPWQQGGLCLVAAGGQLLHVQRNRDAGERPYLDAVLAALSRRPGR